MKITDEELLALCTSEIANIDENGDLSSDRAEGMDRYMGAEYGDEMEGRSQVRTRQVMETVEGLMPSLMRVMAEEENLVIFQPQGPEDEEQAEQETDVISHIFWQENRGFWNLYSFCKDALLSKTGVLKVWADKTPKHEREEYKGIDDIQLGQLLADDSVNREVVEYESGEDGAHNIIFSTTTEDAKICIAPFAPEEFGVSSSARSPYVADQSFCYGRHRKTVADLLMEGYDRDFIDSLPSDENNDIETLARRNLSDEQNIANDKLREVWITECYFRCDRDEDGIAELLKVTIAASESADNAKFMDAEEVDAIPFFATPSHPLTHKFYGQSIPDIIKDLQQIQTVLLRQTLDNTYLANSGIMAANTDYVNIEDLLTRRPNGIARYKGPMPWNAVMGPVPHSPLPAQTLEIFNRLDESQRRRTGYGDEVGALDVSALANMNTGVAALAFDMARSKVELIARVIAEIGLKPLFHRIHELAMKNGYKKRALKLRGKWAQVDPSNWKTRIDSDVGVGIGKVSRERRIMGHEAVLAKQQELVSQGAMGTLIQPHHVYEANKGWIKALGFEPSLYIQDPRELPPPPPKPPDQNTELLKIQGQAMMLDGQSKMIRAENEKSKIAIEAAKVQAEIQYRQQETLIKAQVEALKAESAQLKADMQTTEKVIDLTAQVKQQQADSQLKEMQIKLNHLNASRDRDLEYYKLMHDSIPGVVAQTDEEKTAEEAAAAQAAMEKEARESNRDLMIVDMFQRTQADIQRMISQSAEPQDIEYDANGLIKRIGRKNIKRDASGRARAVEQ